MRKHKIFTSAIALVLGSLLAFGTMPISVFANESENGLASEIVENSNDVHELTSEENQKYQMWLAEAQETIDESDYISEEVKSK